MEVTGRDQKLQQLHSAIFTGDALRTYIADSGVSVLKKRDSLESVEDYLRGREKRVLGLCGLRRTGRTTLLYQAIDALGLYEDSLLLIGSSEDSGEDVRQLLIHSGCHYIFVDDMDKISDFVQNCGFLADELTQSGKKVVLSGGDGDEMILLKEGALSGKLHLIRTSYVSFREYQRFYGASLDGYFEYQSELSREKIQKIADKYADTSDDIPEVSVFLGKTGKILKAMDVLAEIPENGRSYHTTFTQPGLIMAAAVSKEEDRAEMRLDRLKDILMTDLLKDFTVSGANVIAKYRSDGGEVFDIVLINKRNRRCVVIQVADTDEKEESQVRNLTDKIVCRELQEYFGGRLVGRYVFYYGPGGRAFRVQYVNCIEFLSRGAAFRNMMEKLEGG